MIVMHFAVATWLCAELNVWIDEFYSMHTTSKDLSYAVSQSIDFEEHPPFYFILLWAWRQVSDSVFWGRTLSVVSTTAFLIVVWRVVRRLLPRIHPAWVVGLAAANPLILHIATEMRPPAFTLLVSGLLVWLFIEGFLGEKPRMAAAIAYCALSVIALYTYYYLGVLLLANGIALLLTRRRPAIALYYGMMVLVAASFLPMVLVSPRQSEAFESRHEFSLSPLGGVRVVIERIQKYVWPSMGLPLDGKLRWIPTGILAAGIAATLVLKRRKIGRPLLVLLAVVAVIASCFSIIAWQLGWQSMMARHAVALVMPVYLALYGILSLYDDSARKRVLIAWTVVVGISSATGIHSNFHHFAKPGDAKRVAAYIEKREKPQEPILVLPGSGSGALGYYYTGVNEFVPIPRAEDFVDYNSPDDTLQNEQQIRDAINLLPFNPASMWVVVNCDGEDCGWLSTGYNEHILDQFIAECCEVNDEQDFYGANVRHCTCTCMVQPENE